MLNAMSAAVFVIIAAFVVGFSPTKWQYLVVTILVAVGVMCLPFSQGWAFQLLENSAIRRLGELSFSVYLIHTPVIYFLLPLKGHGELANVLLGHLAIVISLILSVYLNKYVEKRFAYKW